jgi:cytohesin
MSLPPPPQDDDPIITQFKPVDGQWGLNDENIKRIDPQSGKTILHNYCKYINTTPFEVYRYLIDTKGCDISVKDKYYNTPLHHALLYFKGGNITVLMYLLSHVNVNISIKNSNSYTLLHIACINIDSLPLDIFKLLIETLGCDVNAQSTYRNTPIHCAIDSFNSNDGGDITVLTYLLTQKDINSNIKGRDGYTLLHTACNNINSLPFKIVKYLIETHGADVNALDNNNETPLHRALDRFNPDSGCDINVFAYLINQTNIDLNIKYKNSYTLLHTTCMINLSNTRYSAKLNAENDTIVCRIIEDIAERYIQQVLDGTTP